MVHVYGIPNCNTVKKALDWLNENKVEFTFHNYKKEGITATRLNSWSKKVGWEKLVNKKGTTWRTLPPEQQEKVKNEKAATELMVQNTSVIKRPVIEVDDKILVGFDEIEYRTFFHPQP